MKEFSNSTAHEIVMLLWEKGPQLRLELSKTLGVQPSTVTRVVNKLLETDYVGEMSQPDPGTRRGFPSKRLYLKPGKILSAGIFVDPERIYTCVIDMAGEVLSDASQSILNASFDSVMDSASQMISTQISKLGKKPEDFFGCGISYPGQHVTDLQKPREVPYLPDWPQFKVTERLAPYFDMPVYHLNDAKSACLAEMLFGSCKKEENFCYIWIAHGIGGAAVIGKRLYIGKNGAAAEFGGLFPKSQPRPSGTDLLQFLSSRGYSVHKLSDISTEMLDSPAIKEWCDRGEAQLRELCLTIACTYAPDTIAFGGQLPDKVFDRILDGLNSDIPLSEREIASPPKIVRAVMDKRPQLGAAAVPLYIRAMRNKSWPS